MKTLHIQVAESEAVEGWNRGNILASLWYHTRATYFKNHFSERFWTKPMVWVWLPWQKTTEPQKSPDSKKSASPNPCQTQDQLYLGYYEKCPFYAFLKMLSHMDSTASQDTVFQRFHCYLEILKIRLSISIPTQHRGKTYIISLQYLITRFVIVSASSLNLL